LKGEGFMINASLNQLRALDLRCLESTYILSPVHFSWMRITELDTFYCIIYSL